MMDLGRIDICCEVSMMSYHLVITREGHLAQVFHIFMYINKHHNSTLVFDLSYPNFNIDTFPKHDCTKLYGDIKEAMPPDMPYTLGKEVVLRCFVDSDHTGEDLTRCSRSSFIILLQMALIYYC